ncbi:MAG: O-antigen ligase family protein [Planctomycetota bacterium]
MSDGHASPDRGRMLRLAGLVGMLGIIVGRTWIAVAPDVVFDVDPAVTSGSMGALGPAGSLLLDVGLLVAAALGLLGEALSGRRLNWRPLLLAVLPMVVILHHGLGDAGDLCLGATWTSGAVAAVALAHLSRVPGARAAIVGVLAAAVVPLLARGAMQVTIEHAVTIEQWETQGESYLAERGWEPGSPAALIFERRLRQPQPTGWFPTANVFASIAATALVLWAGLAIGAARGRLSSGSVGLAGLMVAASGVGLFMTGARAGMGAAIIGAGVLALPLLGAPGQALARRAAALLGGLVVFVLIAVAVRGVAMPEGFGGERSLLFRWHYLAAAGQVISGEPIVGVGPDGFQDAYVGVRSPRSPEEVTSAHSIGVDWLATLGLGGLFFLGLAGMMIAGAGRHAPLPRGSEPDEAMGGGDHRTALIVVPATAALAAALALPVEWSTLIDVSIFMRFIGVFGFIATGLITASLFCNGPRAWMEWTLVAAVAALLVHLQVELTGSQAGAVGCCWALLGLLLRVDRRPEAADQPNGSLAPILLGVLPALVAVVLLVTAALPAMRQARGVADAASALSDYSSEPAAALAQRRRAVDLLTTAYEAWPANERPLTAAIRQAMRAATIMPAESMVWLGRANELADRLVDDHPELGSRVIRTGVRLEVARAVGAPEAWEAAVADARFVTRGDPHGIGPWLALGDIAWEAGRRDDAGQAYRQALANSDNFELDVLKQVSPTDRARVESRLDVAFDGR